MWLRAGRGDWVSQTGAHGVQVVGSRGQAFALKVLDGNITAQVAAAVEVMAQLGWLDAAQAEALVPRRVATIATVRGRAVGERRPVLQLQRVV
ncbi:MAG: asparaginase [Burkholderiaceae bacterium]